MIVVVDNGVTVEVAPETIRSRMHRSIIHQRIYAAYNDIAETMGYEGSEIISILSDFGAISPRVKITKGTADFEFINHTDTVEAITAKFERYNDFAPVTLIEKIIAAVNKLDEPHNPDLTSGALPDDVEKKD